MNDDGLQLIWWRDPIGELPSVGIMSMTGITFDEAHVITSTRCTLLSDHAKLKTEVKRLREVLNQFEIIREAETSQRALMSCQGQAMDGFSALANYQSVIDNFLTPPDEKG